MKLVDNFLRERKKRPKSIKRLAHGWKEILFGMPQGSIMGPIWFNIFLSDLFQVVEDIDFVNYADDNEICCAGDNMMTLKYHYRNLLQSFSRPFGNLGIGIGIRI